MFLILMVASPSFAQHSAGGASSSSGQGQAQTEKPGGSWLAKVFGKNKNKESKTDASACYCQVGDNPAEVFWYRQGCRMWLSQNKCPRNSPVVSVSQSLTRGSITGLIKVGFVGHGGHPLKGIDQLAAGGPVFVDDTSCSNASSPERISGLLKAMKGGSNVTFRGVQTISTGMWDKILPGKHNIPATITTRGVQYPECAEYENKGCSSMVQKGQTAKCNKGGQTTGLQCSPGGLGYAWKARYAL